MAAASHVDGDKSAGDLGGARGAHVGGQDALSRRPSVAGSAAPNVRRRPVVHVLAGAGAGAIASVVTCPLDVAKTKLQNQAVASHQLHFRRYSGVVGTLQYIARHDGLRGFYRGLVPTLTGLLPNWAIYFSSYEWLKEESSVLLGRPRSSPAVHLLSATGAGAVCALATNPLWLVKTRLMTQTKRSPYHYDGMVDAFRQILRHEGMRGFYKGLGPSLLGIVHAGIQFPLYEQLKMYFQRRHASRATELAAPAAAAAAAAGGSASGGSASAAAEPDARDGVQLAIWEIIVASSVSKIVSTVAWYPHEVIRTRFQNQYLHPPKYSSVFNAVTTIVKEEGYYALYNGLGTNLLRVVPAGAITFVSYEVLVVFLGKLF